MSEKNSLLNALLWLSMIVEARVFLGVHFPLDMAGAVAVAAIAYAIVSPLWRMAGGALIVLAERLYPTALARPIAAGWLRALK